MQMCRIQKALTSTWQSKLALPHGNHTIIMYKWHPSIAKLKSTLAPSFAYISYLSHSKKFILKDAKFNITTLVVITYNIQKSMFGQVSKFYNLLTHKLLI